MHEDKSSKSRNNKTMNAVIAIVLIALLICVVVHVLFKLKSPFQWLEAEWTAGEILTFIASVIIFIGTFLLGVHTSESANKYQKIANKLSEDNNRLQKILAQKSLPVFMVTDAKTFPTMDCDHIDLSILNMKQSFTIMGVYSNEKTSIKVCINVDANNTKSLVKPMILHIENISEVPIRYLSIEKIVINGFKDHFDMLECKNAFNPKAGRPLAIRPMQTLQIDLNVFYDNKKYENVWENNLGGLTLTLFIENTSLSGEKFQQNICVCASNNGLFDVKYGDNSSTG